ncbi:hypothetical protein KVR01_005728 [Diaporthe batatas]|uniref:uncharacterized protein n=1 Tax=Diaporthe batatas TaxID=748121 RepID=UPI001D058AC7|nr:uncharacterized protein KVR01_005728 [Diaporthe batatas]KAG8163810.1 hypothetical protein KVR01_005728 [Diaporthe batatas]
MMPRDTPTRESENLIVTPTVTVDGLDSRTSLKDQEHIGVSRRTRGPLISWWLEGLAVVVSLLLLAAIVSLLYHFDGEEQPEWPYWINLNTVVATLSTILRAQLLLVAAEAISQYKWSWFRRPRRLIDMVRFDEASRGLMGSLNFLFRPRKSFVALCSALAFVLSAAIGPFTQQTIRTFGCEILSHNESASVPIAEYLDFRTDIDTYNSGDSYIVSPQMSIAVLEGIVGSTDQDNQVSASSSCRTGNCDFQSPGGGSTSYSSLAICSSCEDITDLVVETHIVEDGPDYWSYNISDTDPTYVTMRDSDDTIFSGDDSYPFMNVQAPNVGRDSHSSASVQFMSFTFADCSLPANYSDRSDWYDKVECPNSSRFRGLQNKVGLLAANCSVNLCVRTYESSIRSGQLEEKTVSINEDAIPVYDLTTAYVDSYKIIRDPCFLDGQRYTTKNLSQVARSPGRNFTSLLVNGESVELPLECTYGVKDAFVSAIYLYLHAIFQTSCKAASWGPGGKWINCFERWWYPPLFNEGNATLASVSDTFEKLSLAITARMRATGMNANGTEPGRAVGTVTRSAVCIQVSWPWLTLHMFLVLWVGLIFAIISYDSWRLREVQPIWKHSSLVPFFHKLRHEGQEDGVPTHTASPMELSSMEDTAAKVVVQLRQDEGGYAFVVEEGPGRYELRSLPPEPASERQSTKAGSTHVLNEPVLGPRFSASVHESLRDSR